EATSTRNTRNKGCVSMGFTDVIPMQNTTTTPICEPSKGDDRMRKVIDGPDVAVASPISSPIALKRVVNMIDKGKGGSSGIYDEGFTEVKNKKSGGNDRGKGTGTRVSKERSGRNNQSNMLSETQFTAPAPTSTVMPNVTPNVVTVRKATGTRTWP
ncbi:hypothetical protein Tco_0363289, partial [Tanacetum coccineum]